MRCRRSGALRVFVLEERRVGCLDAYGARCIWRALEELETIGYPRDGDGFMNMLSQALPEAFYRYDLWDYARKRYSPQADGFWQEIWSTFRVQLRRELKLGAGQAVADCA